GHRPRRADGHRGDRASPQRAHAGGAAPPRSRLRRQERHPVAAAERRAPRPMTRDEIPTPALLLDLDRFERNIARMATHVRAAGKALRPHAKTHRCPEIARRQVAAGALGVACAKLGEAEVMARAGIRGLLITTEVVPPASIRRLTRLAGEAPDTMVVVDHPDNARALNQAAAEDA